MSACTLLNTLPPKTVKVSEKEDRATSVTTLTRATGVTQVTGVTKKAREGKKVNLRGKEKIFMNL